MERLALLPEPAVRHEISNLAPDDRQLVELPFGLAVAEVKRHLEFFAPFGPGESCHFFARRDSPLQQRQVDKDVLGPREERIDRAHREPVGLLRELPPHKPVGNPRLA